MTEPVQVFKSQAAPRRPQQGQPRNPVGGLRQCARNGGEVLHHAVAPAAIELGAADLDFGPAQGMADFLAMRAAANENSDGVVRAFFQGVSHEPLDDCNLRFMVALAEMVQLDPGGFRGRARGRFAGRIGHRAHVRIAAGRKDLREYLVEPADKHGCRTEVDSQFQQFRPQLFQPQLANPQVTAHVGFAEPVDGLHGISHHEYRASVPVLPLADHLLQQVQLGAGGILKLVHQDVAQPRIQAFGEERWPIGLPQGPEGRLADLGVVGFPPLGEQDLEMRKGVSQDPHDAMHQFQAFIFVRGRFQDAQTRKALAKLAGIANGLFQFRIEFLPEPDIPVVLLCQKVGGSPAPAHERFGSGGVLRFSFARPKPGKGGFKGAAVLSKAVQHSAGLAPHQAAQCRLERAGIVFGAEQRQPLLAPCQHPRDQFGELLRLTIQVPKQSFHVVVTLPDALAQ